MIARCIIPLLLAHVSIFAQPQLVRDIAPGTASSAPSNPFFTRITALGNTVLFKANDGVTGPELWRSDGTIAGTELVRDIYAGADQDGVQEFFIIFDSVLYFLGRNAEYGAELWRSDGTAAGTFLFWDACTGFCNGPNYGSFLPEFAVLNDTLFFRSSTANSGTEVFFTNGDSSSVFLLKEISSGAGSSSPGKFCTWNDLVFFSATSFSAAREPWITDGTPNGTKLLKDINPGGFSSSDPDNFTPSGDKLYFSAVTAGAGRELWKTDGTETGTVMVRDINPGTGNSIVADFPFQTLGDLLVFAANDGVNGIELWTSDGSEAGTQLLKNIGPGGSNSLVYFLGRLNDYLFLSADDGSGSELWITDGTPAGTKQVKEIFPGVGSGVYLGGPSFNGKMNFTANDGIHGVELWQTDGTAEGTILLADINTGAAESNPSGLTLVGSTLYFFATTNAYGRELWKYDLKPPVAGFSAPDSVCQSETVTFMASTPVADVLSWHFGANAQPEQAQGQGPHEVTYSVAGDKMVRLIASNSFGADTAFQTLKVLPLPQPDFSSQADELTVTFTNSSLNASGFNWDFGDGQQSTEVDPVHTYTAPGEYTVTLQAYNDCSSIEKSIVLILTSAQRQARNDLQCRLYPNPATETLRLAIGLAYPEQMLVTIHDVLGNIVQTTKVSYTPGMEIPINIGALPSGLYRLRAESLDGRLGTMPVIIAGRHR